MEDVFCKMKILSENSNYERFSLKEGKHVLKRRRRNYIFKRRAYVKFFKKRNCFFKRWYNVIVIVTHGTVNERVICLQEVLTI